MSFSKDEIIRLNAIDLFNKNEYQNVKKFDTIYFIQTICNEFSTIYKNAQNPPKNIELIPLLNILYSNKMDFWPRSEVPWIFCGVK